MANSSTYAAGTLASRGGVVKSLLFFPLFFFNITGDHKSIQKIILWHKTLPAPVRELGMYSREGLAGIDADVVVVVVCRTDMVCC